jgi:hypothetical protein
MAAILVGGFGQQGALESFIQFCLAKQDRVLVDAAARLAAHFG